MNRPYKFAMECSSVLLTSIWRAVTCLHSEVMPGIPIQLARYCMFQKASRKVFFNSKKRGIECPDVGAIAPFAIPLPCPRASTASNSMDFDSYGYPFRWPIGKTTCTTRKALFVMLSVLKASIVSCHFFDKIQHRQELTQVKRWGQPSENRCTNTRSTCIWNCIACTVCLIVLWVWVYTVQILSNAINFLASK